jgi:putative tryptophan/tyrosine transport system substrate-binding protein
MRRRDLLAGLLATTTASALRAAEPTRVYRLAACTQLGKALLSNEFWTLIFDRLRRLGYVEGKTLIVDRYAADGHAERFADIAADVVRSKPDVIVVLVAHQLILRLAEATSTIPIAVLVGDPVAAGLVQNIARPERNITGIAADAGVEMQGKHLDIMRQVVPSASRIAYLSPRYEWQGAWGRAVREAGDRVGISIIGTPVEVAADEMQYRQAFETMRQQSAQALMYNGLGPNYLNRFLITELALEYRLASIGWFLDVVKAHGLLAYATDSLDMADRLAGQIDQIFRGAKAADIPFYQPTKFTLAVNLKTAKALGLNIPSALLASADEVIE